MFWRQNHEARQLQRPDVPLCRRIPAAQRRRDIRAAAELRDGRQWHF